MHDNLSMHVVTKKAPKSEQNGKILNFRDFRDKTRKTAIYINFREKSRNRGKPVSLRICRERVCAIS